MRRLPLLVVAALVLLGLAVAPAAEAKKRQAPMPSVTSVTPMRIAVGQTLVVRGRHFRPGKGRNSLGFKRDGSAIVFVKAGLSTRRMMQVKLPAKLEKVMGGAPTRFRLRVLTARFARTYTARNRSPLVSPRPADGVTTAQPVPAAAQPEADCDADGQVNRLDTDDDNDGLDDTLENRIGTDACAIDTDGDTVQDGYEYRSAIDLNDDEYRSPQTSLPYPGKRPYPNPLDKSDANIDHDGDGLTLVQEQALWKRAGTGGFADPAPPAVTPLSYSAGLQYSVSVYDAAGRRVPSLQASSYGRWQDFLSWADASGYGTVTLHDSNTNWPKGSIGWHDYALRDVDRDGVVQPSEVSTLDRLGRGAGVLSDDERDEDADGLSNFVELSGELSSPDWWASCYTREAKYPVPYVGTDPTNEDSDGDGIRDGADDQDFDDVPNLMEVSRIAASGIIDGTRCLPGTPPPADVNHPDAYGYVQPFDPCKPDPDSRTCRRYVHFGDAVEPNWWALN